MLSNRPGIAALAAIACYVSPAAALDNGLAITPQMGWVSQRPCQPLHHIVSSNPFNRILGAHLAAILTPVSFWIRLKRLSSTAFVTSAMNTSSWMTAGPLAAIRPGICSQT